MIEIIPNWHPLFVHFPIALLSMATLFFIMEKIMNKHPVQAQLKILAYWNLWIGTGFAIVAAVAGWFAYNSVAHDTPSHEAMTEHRNWALATLTTFFVVSVWSLINFKKIKETSVLFILAMLVGFVLLTSTAWRGGEAVYRYGLGVMSLPQVEGEGHAHEHADGEGHSQNRASGSVDMDKSTKTHGHKDSIDNAVNHDGHHKNSGTHNHSGHKH